MTDMVSDGVVSLPIYSSLTDESVDKVCEVIRRARGFDNANLARWARGAA
jgi:dTDP-4-amino-4,6-dideoxygalactose transaminase